MNSKDIADGIAACFTGASATNGSVTESLAFGPTATLPNQLAKGPALLVFPPTGNLGVTLRRRDDTLVFRVRLLRDPLNVPQRVEWMYAWYDAMRDLVEANMDLGLAYVAWARVTDMGMDLDGFSYAGVPYDVVDLTVAVRLDEVISTLAV